VTNVDASPSARASTAFSRIERARRLSDHVFSHVRPEAWLDRPIPERHRLLFYLGHLEAFDWNQIASLSSDPLDRLFAFGIDPPPGELPRDEPCGSTSAPHAGA
jgi:hypothetical protein